MKAAIDLVERGFVPDWLTRQGIRMLLRERLREIGAEDPETAVQQLMIEMQDGPIALHPSAANDQHYEVPAQFFELILGPHLKYSAAHWPEHVKSLWSAEEAMLALTCKRAGIRNGQNILDLGCGWGSLSLWIASRYPDCTITAVSNSASQGDHVRARARRLGLGNVRVRTADMNAFSTDERYDRVVSVEMFEHMRNIGALLARIRRWLRDDGMLFVHIFVHREHAYPFEVQSDHDWMAEHFFTGGMMPREDLLTRFPEHFDVIARWRVDGTHYSKTLEAWLSNLDQRRAKVMPVLAATYGDEAERWLHRWRLFLLACSELFGYRSGQEWMVGHYLLQPAGNRHPA